MKERYDLPNRDGDKVWLKRIKNNMYLLDMEHDYPIQVTYDNKNKEKIVAVDPSGGPFMYLGYEVECGIEQVEGVERRVAIVLVQDIKFEKGLGFIFTLTE